MLCYGGPGGGISEAGVALHELPLVSRAKQGVVQLIVTLGSFISSQSHFGVVDDCNGLIFVHILVVSRLSLQFVGKESACSGMRQGVDNVVRLRCAIIRRRGLIWGRFVVIGVTRMTRLSLRTRQTA